ncbi:papilin [Salmo trutta]|uniref:papilin n=1 Tax=Salmo trutta TaxID=8032 RepID=UPI00113204A5|nr:papilin-like [Salmo trutta]
MKMLWSLVALQLFLAPALLLPSGDYWQEWSPYGECSRTCGSGVTMRTRRCVTQRTDGGNNCVGPDKSYRSCNIQDCPEGSRDFREEQCSQFDGSDFQGKRYKWLPYYGADNPCELNCIPRGENFFYRQKTAVVDGTPCHPGRRDVCVDGVCKRLGCDNMLESPQQEDPCLQCGGNGQSCFPVRSTFDINNLPKGYNQMFIIPVGATSIRIGETVATRNYLAIKNLRGEYYLNGHWVIEFSRAAPVAGTMLYYQRGAEGEMTPETIIGRGPTTEPLVIELISQEHNQGVEYEYYLPHGHSREGYYWSFGSWSACSRECGSGYQSRLVFCAIDNEAYPDYLCSALPRPLTNRTCNTQQCPQTHRMAYLYQPHVWTPSETPRTYVYSWTTGEWNVCSVSCGGGSQVRSVQCVSHDASGPRVVEDAVCAAYALAPPTLQTCNMQRCVSWRASVWSACSVTCGTGDQSREVMCVGAASVQLADTSCSASLRPVATQPCSMPACLLAVSWHVGDWGLCSKSCASGLRERQVMCSDRERNLYPVKRCNSNLKPLTVETCNTQPCYRPQVVPSMQNPRGQDNTQQGFIPYVPDHPTVLRPDSADQQTNTVYHAHSSGPAQHCSRTHYGCCPDGVMAAGGTGGLGCPRGSSRPPSPEQSVCTTTRYGCCRDGVTISQGFNKEGCLEYVPPAHPTAPPAPLLPAENSIQCRLTTYGCCFNRMLAAAGPDGEGCPTPPDNVPRTTCSLPKAAGSCSGWTGRYFYDVTTATCSHFWYGGCHGNNNNFLTRGDCQSRCPGTWTSQTSHTYQLSQSGTGHDMSRVFTVQRGSSGGSTGGRKGISTADHAHRARVHVRPRRPAPHSVQQTYPAASLTQPGGVKIDQSDPTTVEALVGQTVVLPCRVSPAPSSTVIVEWRKDGVPLTTFRHHPQPNGSLLVGPLTKADSGWLLCVATRDRERDHRYVYLSVSENSRGPQVVQDATGSLPQDGADRTGETGSLPQDGADRTGETGVILPSVPHRQPSPKFSIDRSGLSSVEGKAGQTVRLACKIVPPSALSSVSIQWTREGQTLNSLRHAQHADGTLVIGQLTSDDSGVYTCTGSTHSQLEQRQLTLKVQGDLRITMAPNNVQVSQGGTAQLPCVVSGDNVNVGWSRNGVPVRPDGGRVQMSSDGSLILNNVQPADEGSYTCNAYTGTYSVSATAKVRINKASQQELDTGVGVPAECVDQPELANCELIVYARLCTSQYYSSFCCASCARHAKGEDRYGQIG